MRIPFEEITALPQCSDPINGKVKSQLKKNNTIELEENLQKMKLKNEKDKRLVKDLEKKWERKFKMLKSMSRGI